MRVEARRKLYPLSTPEIVLDRFKNSGLFFRQFRFTLHWTLEYTPGGL